MPDSSSQLSIGPPVPGWRILLRGELVLLHVIAVAAIVAMVLAGRWQLEAWREYQALDRLQQAEQTPVPLASVLGPDDALTGRADGAVVRVEGRWAPAGDQFLLPGRLPGRSWVVSPLLVDGTESGLLVVRGSTAGERLPAVPAGPVSVTGVVQPSESFGTQVSADRRVEALNVSVLVGAVPYDLYAAYAVRTGQSPPDPTALDAVSPSRPDASWTAGIHNLVYAIQWWLFAAFTGFMWWRIARDRVSEHQAMVLDRSGEGSHARRPAPRTPVA